jgi:sugar (pentulose or hexulose) kinase
VALNRRFAPDPRTRRRTLEALDLHLDAQLPCAVLTYPLGELTEERFPFRKTGIAEFVQGRPSTTEEHYAAVLQGIAFVERWCYEKLQGLGARVERIFSTGGGSRSRPWCSLRADVLGKPVHLPVEPETALGTAVLAAAHLCGSIEAASGRMVRQQRSVAPGPRRFDDLYQQFRDECRRRWGV